MCIRDRFTTGYLTQRGKSKENCFQLTIPDMEIRNIFTTQIMDFFKENVSKNGDALRKFCEALKNGNAEDVEKQLSEYLRKTIDVYKRQGLPMALVYMVFPISSVLICIRLLPKLKNKMNFIFKKEDGGDNLCCLLYTSRCV